MTNANWMIIVATLAVATAAEALAALPDGLAQTAVPVSRSPENQIFQFRTSDSCLLGPGQRRTATAYLWIPPSCRRVRGVVVAGRNLTEHWLVGHPAIRKACADSDLAMLWCCPTFYDITVKDGKRHGEFLQQLLARLAAQSGYDELASAAWLPMGESNHLEMVKQLVDAWPERCIAGVQVKNGMLNQQSTRVPILSAIGTCYEWDQEKIDLLQQWKNVSFCAAHQKRRADRPEWPGSLILEPASGHFECTEAMAMVIAEYLLAAADARLSRDGSGGLRPVELDDGYVAGLPVPGEKPFPPTRYRDCRPESRSLPWYFNKRLAEMACAMVRTNWNAESQVPAFADAVGEPLPFGHRGIFSPLPYATLADGVTFQLATTFLRRIPVGFVKAGTALGHAPGRPVVQWICGQASPLGENRFRIALDRTWPDSPT